MCRYVTGIVQANVCRRPIVNSPLLFRERSQICNRGIGLIGPVEQDFAGKKATVNGPKHALDLLRIKPSGDDDFIGRPQREIQSRKEMGVAER